MLHVLENNFIGTGETKDFKFKKVHESKTSYVFKVNNSYYEVFLRKKVPLCIDFANRIYSQTEYKEIYPKSKDFGTWAWTTNSLEKALSIVNEKDIFHRKL